MCFQTQSAWRSLFSTAGECSLCDYKYTPRNKSTANSSRFCTNLRMHLDAYHPGAREEVVRAAFELAIEEARNVAQMYTTETSNRQTPTVPKNGYACEECGQLFASPKECLKHRNAAHPRHSNSFHCSACGEGMFLWGMLQKYATGNSTWQL